MSRAEVIDDLTQHVTGFFRALEARRTSDADRIGLTSTEYRALARVVEIGQKTPKDLASSMGMSTGAITAITDHLVARGLLERIANPLDRRSIMLQPTADGRETIRGLFEAYRDVMADAANGSTDEQITQLTELLARITTQLRP